MTICFWRMKCENIERVIEVGESELNTINQTQMFWDSFWIIFNINFKIPICKLGLFVSSSIKADLFSRPFLHFIAKESTLSLGTFQENRKNMWFQAKLINFLIFTDLCTQNLRLSSYIEFCEKFSRMTPGRTTIGAGFPRQYYSICRFSKSPNTNF